MKSIIEQINEYVVKPNVLDQRAKLSHYPSEASVKSRLDDQVIGKCHRAAYYSWKGIETTNPVDARGMWTFMTGKLIETAYVEYCKELGIWAANNVKFFNPIHNVSGEVDLFVFNEDKKLIMAEIKTAYGYGFQNSVMKFPKMENLLQVALYLDFFKNIPECRLIYKARDTQEDIEYVVSLKEENKEKFLMVNYSIPVQLFHIQDIYDRYAQLGKYLMDNIEPPRDYTYGFTLEQSKERLEKGVITKSRYTKIEKCTVMDSDWNCVYCSYLDLCWKDKRKEIKMKKIEEDVEVGI